MLKTNNIVVSILHSEEETLINFFKIIRSTTNTCEIQELKKNIIKCVGNLQEVEPDFNNFKNNLVLRKKIKENKVIIDKNIFASLWEGIPLWQTSFIYIPSRY
jgi:hypothetical protein